MNKRLVFCNDAEVVLRIVDIRGRRVVKDVNLVYILFCLITIYYIPKRCTAKAIHLSE